ncbi:hypothetical protein ILUMI_20570 [Ignelater luminosus]|uniref:Myotubularin phosphatase domain-containing protein n=1 Tax=Ignelater luminosus TaxID=2038154 RepID=A0A8K0G4R7_IGNLU|nr:hypothetical protein ILUMI_20570 [Ignelater luminosus]
MCDNTNIQNTVAISSQDIRNLISYFSKNTYRAREVDPIGNEILQKCIELMKIDYSIFLISNNNGELSSNYPNQLMFLERENAHNQTVTIGNSNSQSAQRATNTIYESLYDPQSIRDQISKARLARCRARFPIPVILYKGKYICRSGTLSGGPEIYGRSGLDYLFYGSDSATEPCNNVDSNEDTTNSQSDWQLFDRVRSQDIKLLKRFNVGTIIDFMVEKKKVKFGMNVTSSEKVDKENRYSDFTIISLPYPGCEFFKEFRDNNYSAEGLVFNWAQTYVDACVCVPDNSITSQLRIEWDKYKNWDLVHITQNYMRLMLKYLQDHSSGMLIHCISGWDRTPLFISLLRLSLWADGVAHQGLDVQQILYLTISYDWMLFGHNLVDRLGKGEEIFFFCFYMLKYIIHEDYSIAGLQRHKSKLSDRSNERSFMRTDSDLYLDGMLLDQDSRGSNISLNSSCSSVSNKSQEQPPTWFNLPEEFANGNTFPPDVSSSFGWSKRTSPVTVPATSRFRQRQESSSSMSVGSWQMVSGSGSLRSSDSSSTIDSNGTNSNRCEGYSSQDSSCTLIDDLDFCVNGGSGDGYSVRRERLQKVRELFYNIYCSVVSSNFKNGTDSSLSSLLGNFAEKVGLAQRTSV